MPKSDDKIKISDKVIVRSNEDDPLIIGEVVRFLESHSSIPIVKSIETGKEYICMGIVKLYSKELLAELKPLTPKEQWNKLALNYKR